MVLPRFLMQWCRLVVLVDLTIILIIAPPILADASAAPPLSTEPWTCDDMTPGLCDDLTVEQGWIPTLHGIQVAYWSYTKASSSDPSMQPVIMVSGGPGVSHTYELPRRALACMHPGRRIFFFDQGGAGDSVLPNNATLVTDPDFAVLLDIHYYAQELDLLIQAWGLEHYHIVAHSWGTQVALQYALDYPRNHLLSLTLSSPIFSSQQHIDDMWDPEQGTLGRLPEYFQQRLRTLFGEGHLSNTNDTEVQSLINNVFMKFYYRNGKYPDCVVDSVSSFNGLLAAALWGPWKFMPPTGTLQQWSVLDRLVPELAPSGVPIFLFSGGNDVVSPARVQAIHASLPQSERRLYPQAGHNTDLDAPNATNYDIADFILRVEQAAAAKQEFRPVKVMTRAIEDETTTANPTAASTNNSNCEESKKGWRIFGEILAVLAAFGIGFWVGGRRSLQG
ncbi:hypothetical protein ACA910_016700 [Epithemia clementina (nom. ined.)]